MREVFLKPLKKISLYKNILMKSPKTKKMRNYKIKTVRSNIIPPKQNKTMYTVEPIDSKTLDPTISGDVYKKYKNGKLVKQVFISKDKFREIINKLTPHFLKTGGTNTPNKKPTPTKKTVVEVDVNPKTGLGYYIEVLKTSFVAGVGFTTANVIVEKTLNSLFEIIFGGEE